MLRGYNWIRKVWSSRSRRGMGGGRLHNATRRVPYEMMRLGGAETEKRVLQINIF